MSYTVELDETDQICNLKVNGRLNIYNIKEFKDIVSPIIERVPALIVDVSEVIEFDSSFIQLFISIKNYAYSLGHIFKITSHSKPILDLLDMYGLVGFFADKVVLSAAQRSEFKLNYGTSKLPPNLR
ncbi:MAG: STAS domain-containing protein [Leptospiraceae bacterium]|nr:STAS domain-containing protein [Leptospiraceae bacterium]MCP5512098.1 STAS domain-containing protein [Leptospiraceae bacterium]